MYLIIGKVIVLAHLQDNGFFWDNEEFIRYNRIKDMKLTINHVYELYSKLITYSMIMKKDPFYTVTVVGWKFDKMSVICHELYGFVFHDGVDEITIYKKILKSMLLSKGNIMVDFNYEGFPSFFREEDGYY